MVVLTCFMSTARAAIVVASAGDGNLIAISSGADTYVLDGHGVFAPPYSMLIEEGVELTGDASSPLLVLTSGYGVVNAGELRGQGAFRGVVSMVDILDDNGGFINIGLIDSAGNVAFEAGGQEIDLRNTGGIIGHGIGSEGIIVGDMSDIKNGQETLNGQLNGVISGQGSAVLAGDSLTLINEVGSMIISFGASGIEALHDLVLLNSGTITGISGVRAAEGAHIENALLGEMSGVNGIFISHGGFVENRGVITGLNALAADKSAISSGHDFILRNFGTIQANEFVEFGVRAGGNADLLNEEGGSILGGTSAAVTFSFGELENHGLISSDGIAVRGGVLGSLELTNSVTGTIEGSVGVLSFTNVDLVTNRGVIIGTGGTAIDVHEGDDFVTLSEGSFVNGAILGGPGTDTLHIVGENFTDGWVENFEDTVKFGGGLSVIDGNLETTLLDVHNGRLSLTQGLSGADVVSVGGAGFEAELGGLQDFVSAFTIIREGGTLSAGLRPLGDDSAQAIGPGYLTHIGSLNFQPGSVLRVDANPLASTHDRIRQNGVLTIDPGSQLQMAPVDVDAPFHNAGYRAIDVILGNVAGNFTSARFFLVDAVVNANEVSSVYDVTNTGLFTSSTVSLSSEVLGGDVYLLLTHDYSAVPGLTPVGVAFGAYLNTLQDSAPGNPLLADFLGFLDYSNGEYVAALMNAYDPSVHAALQNAALHDGRALIQAVWNHRLGAYRATPLAVHVGDKSGIASSDEVVSDWAIWSAAVFDNLEYQHDGGAMNLGNLDGDRRSLVAGLERNLAPDLTVGMAVMAAESNLDGGVDAETKAQMMALYANYGGSHGWQASALMGYGNYQIDSRRSVFPSESSARYDASGIMAALEVGYRTQSGAFNWGPTLGFEYLSADVDGFQESGPMSLSIRNRQVDSTRFLLGLDAKRSFERVRWFGGVRLAYDITAEDQDDIVAGFAGLPGSFRVPAASRSEFSIILNTGVSMKIRDALALSLSYNGEVPLEGGGLTSHGVSMEAKYYF